MLVNNGKIWLIMIGQCLMMAMMVITTMGICFMNGNPGQVEHQFESKSRNVHPPAIHIWWYPFTIQQ